jgi:hypothetical protein
MVEVSLIDGIDSVFNSFLTNSGIKPLKQTKNPKTIRYGTHLHAIIAGINFLGAFL